MGKIVKRNRKKKTGLVVKKSAIPSDNEKLQDEYQSKTSTANDPLCTATVWPSSEEGDKQIIQETSVYTGSCLPPAADEFKENKSGDNFFKSLEVRSELRIEPVQFDEPQGELLDNLLQEIHNSLLETAVLEKSRHNILYGLMRTREEFTGQWVLTSELEQYAPLQKRLVHTHSSEGKLVLTGPVALSTPGDGWCLMRAAVGSYNLQLRRPQILSLHFVATALSQLMVDNIDEYSLFAGLSRSTYIGYLKKYFLEKDYDHEVADVLPYALSRALEVNIEINDRHAEMVTRIVIDESWDNIVLDKTINHYSQVVIVKEVSYETIYLLKHMNFGTSGPIPEDELKEPKKFKTTQKRLCKGP